MAVLEEEVSISQQFLDSISVLESKSNQVQLLDTDWLVVLVSGKTIADGLREASLRTSLGKTTLIKSCGKLLSHSGITTKEQRLGQTELLRTIGNLCFDHDENRALSHAAVLPALLVVLSSVLGLKGDTTSELQPEVLSMDDLTLVRACVGALLNMSLKYDPVREDLKKPSTLIILLALVDSRTASNKTSLPIYTTGSWAVAPSIGKEEWEKRIQMGSLIMTWTINMLEDLLADDKSFFPQSGLVALASIILTPPPLVNSTVPSPWSDDEEATELLESDLHFLTTASSLLEALSIELESAKQEIAFATYLFSLSSSSSSSNSLLSHLFTFIETSSPPHHWSTTTPDPEFGIKVFSTIKSAVMRSVIEAPNSDIVMDRLFEEGKQEEGGKSWVVKQLVGWMENEVEGREDLLILGSHMLAALGRKDEYCLSLVQEYGLSTPLSKVVREKAKQQFAKTGSRTGEVTQILFGVVSLLRHLAIPAANKELLGEGEIIESVSTLLVSELDIVGPLQAAVIGLLKQLTVSNVSNSVRFVTSLIPVPPSVSASTSSPLLPDLTPLEYTLALIHRTDDVRLRSESTRILVNVVRSLFSTKPSSHSNNNSDFVSASPITPVRTEFNLSSISVAVDQVEILKRRGKPRIVTAEVVEALSEMVRLSEKYPMLINEGIVALTLVAGSGAIGALLVLDALLKVHTVVSSPPSTEEIEPGSPLTTSTPRRTTSLSLSPSGDPTTSLTMLINWLGLAASTSLLSSTTATTSLKGATTNGGLQSGMIANACALLITVLRGGDVAKGDKNKLRVIKEGIVGPLMGIGEKEGIEVGLKGTVKRALEVAES